MRRSQLLGVALLAVFLFGALTVASASGAVTFLLALWLFNGGTFTGNLPVDMEGDLKLLDVIAGVTVEILCEGLFEGTVNGANGEDELTKLWNLSSPQEEINKTALVEVGLSCVNIAGCVEPLVWATKLPWRTLMELMEENAEVFFVDLFFTGGGGPPGLYVQCMGGTKLEEECLVHEPEEAGAKLAQEGETVDAAFEEAFTLLAELLNLQCSLGGVDKGVLTGLVIIKDTGAGTLSASSEG